MEFALNDFPDSQSKPERQVFTSNFKGRKKDCIKIIRYLPGVIKHGAPEHFFITAKPEMVELPRHVEDGDSQTKKILNISFGVFLLHRRPDDL